MPSAQFLEAFRPYMIGTPQDEAVMIERAPGPGSQPIDITALMQGPSVAAPRQKRTIGNVLSDIFSNRPDARGVPTSEKIVGLGDAFINAGRLWRGDSPIDTVGPMRQERLRMEGIADADEARNVFAELLLNPSPETEAAAARIDPMGVLDYRKQQAAVDQSQAELTRGRVADALAAVAGSEDPAALWSQLATDFEPEVAARIGQMLRTGIPAERLAQAYGFEAPRQGTQPKELQIYSMLQAEDPALADSYLKSIANPDAMTEREAAMLEIALGNFGLAQRAADREDRKLAITEDKAARQAAGGADLTPTQRGVVVQKLKEIPTIAKQLSRVKELATKMQSEGTFARGAVAGLLPGQVVGGDAEVFDRAVDLLRQQIRKLTRTPGEGSMSDYESRLAAATVPSRWGSDAGRAESIASLEELIKGLESGYSEMLGPQTSTKTPARTNSSGRSVKGGRVDPRLEAAMRKKGMTP